MPTSQTVRRDSGFSFIEVMIAMTAFSIVLLSSVGTIAYQQDVLRKNEERVYVSKILESRIEEIRDLTFDEIGALSATTTFTVDPAITIYGQAVNNSIVNSDYQLNLNNVTGTVYIDSLATDLAQVSVEISWKSGLSSVQVSMETTTYITRNGISRQ